jgi:hypothetical protein
MMRTILDMCDDVIAVPGKWLGEKILNVKLVLDFCELPLMLR